ncbi:L,D-transpeptidase family protein [Wenjunlia tyrosinilytica]|uniref:L,D-TPase catalytic domain-containing protein n=1 Tax=Wenjunlia tyrosinilytica TaxID=1544741 RepID=A0A918DXS9_9ACTN|nr:L,D-transpeptidase family protein [Wenjunlia tyrosinilytica]GGO89862.1 hypothetical protein GCM10012280_34050 [Wenjunlia tyrosinilytica]
MTRHGSSAARFSLRAAAAMGALVLIGSIGGATASAQGAEGDGEAAASSPFPVPVEVGNARQVVTVKATGSYAVVAAWRKRGSSWAKDFSANGRVGAKGVVDGDIRKQGTFTTPGGTFTLTEGFGVVSSSTAMPYHRVNKGDWWVEDPQSRFYNSRHSDKGADFPLTEKGDRGSEHLINYPVQYAKALVIDFNRWPAVPGRGAGIFLHVNGRGATAGCVSVPRATMDKIMKWAEPGRHPRIAIA